MSGQHGCIGVDLDGTLAHYDGWKGAEHIGDPVPAMLDRVKQWILDGREVRIFTARVSDDGGAQRIDEAERAFIAIRRWCLEHVGQEIQITCVKDYAMIELYDDRAVQVEANTGRLIGASMRGI